MRSSTSTTSPARTGNKSPGVSALERGFVAQPCCDRNTTVGSTYDLQAPSAQRELLPAPNPPGPSLEGYGSSARKCQAARKCLSQTGVVRFLKLSYETPPGSSASPGQVSVASSSYLPMSPIATGEDRAQGVMMMRPASWQWSVARESPQTSPVGTAGPMCAHAASTTFV
jgi:hypothetical protein